MSVSLKIKVFFFFLYSLLNGENHTVKQGQHPWVSTDILHVMCVCTLIYSINVLSSVLEQSLFCTSLRSLKSLKSLLHHMFIHWHSVGRAMGTVTDILADCENC